MKRLSALFFVLLLLCTLPVRAVSGQNERTVLGADLTDTQIKTIYRDFNVERGTMRELYVENSEEHALLDDILGADRVGGGSFSCVYLRKTEEGSGIVVERHNIDWCTEEMYRSAMETVGITDVRIVISAPFPVSGTSALVGIYKAYEDITGEPLSREARRLGAEQLLLSQSLAEELGSSRDAENVMGTVRELLLSSAELTDEELRQRILALAEEKRVTLNDSQVRQLCDLCRSIERLEPEKRAEQAKEAMEKVSELKEKAEGLKGKWEDFREDFSRFMERMAQWGERLQSLLQRLCQRRESRA